MGTPQRQSDDNSPARPRRTPIYSFTGSIPSGSDPKRSFEAAARQVMRWAASRHPDAPADSAWSSNVDLDGQTGLSVAHMESKGLWSLRLFHPDQPFLGTPPVAGRQWRSEVSLKRGKSSHLCSVQLQLLDEGFVKDPIRFTRPKIVKALAKNAGLQSGRPLTGLWELASEEDLIALQRFLTSPDRTLPLLLVSQREIPGGSADRSPWIYKPDYLADELVGIAHVASIPFDLGFKWSSMVGKSWSCYSGAIRVYRLLDDFEPGKEFRHELIFPPTIKRMGSEFGSQVGEMLLRSQRSVATRGGCRNVPEIRAELLEERLKQASGAERQVLLDEKILALSKKLGETEAARDGNYNEWSKSQEAVDELKDQLLRQRLRAEYLESQLVSRGQPPPPASPRPTGYDELAEWVRTNMVGQLELHNRAIRGLKKAQFEDFDLVVSALELLAGPYRRMRLGHPGAAEEYAQQAASLGLQESGSIEESRAGEFGETYFVRDSVSDQRRFLKFHLRKGTAHDERFTLAIYFYWDEEMERAVVGWLPSHLDNRFT